MLDGFTIEGGYATGYLDDHGRRIDITSGTAFGILVIRGNEASYGGGMYILGGIPSLMQVIFDSNTAFNSGGGRYLAQVVQT